MKRSIIEKYFQAARMKPVLLLFCALILIMSASRLALAYNYEPLEESSMFICDGNATGCFYKYLSGIYSFFIGASGIAAMGMIIWGGIQYFFAAGNVAKTSGGKDMIMNALFGLFIVMVSYLILYVINPDLVTIEGVSNIGVYSTPFYSGTPSSQTERPDTGEDEGTSDTGEEYGDGLKNCAKFGTQAGISQQCGDASDSLEKMLECMKSKLGTNYSKYQVSSISDSQGLDNCRNDTGTWKRPPCAHGQNSCHYNRQTGASQSYAVDFSYRNLSGDDKSTLQSAASACGGKPLSEGDPPHLHVSAPGCGS